MNKFGKIFSLLLALSLVVFVSCDKKQTTTTTGGKEGIKVDKVDVDFGVLDDSSDDPHTNLSRKFYAEHLGEFYEYYLQALEQTHNSTRHALMAIAEAKLLQSGVLVPTINRGGNRAITRVAFRTITTQLWGSNEYRFHNAIVTNELIKAADREELRTEWIKRKGTGTYDQFVLDYLAKKGYTLSKTYSIGYATDVREWDTLASSRSADAEIVVKTFDGLYEYDDENIHQPALATGYTLSDDGLTYTFNIRQGVKWVDYQGREIAEVTADDFVAGLQHMCDAQGGLEFLVEGVIKGAKEYISGETTDFSTVGVKAKDKYTLVYELEKKTPYFTTMLSYNCFAPLCRSYFLARGGAFGVDEFAAAVNSDSYAYALGADSIAYCGPYLITNATRESTYVFERNPTYWNAKNVRIDKIVYLYNDGKDPLKAYNDTKSGVLSGAGLNANAVEEAKKDGLFNDYAYTTDTNATSFMMFLNINRAVFENKDGAMASPMSQPQREASALAMQNKNFRMALAMSMDRGAWRGQSVGEELKLVSVSNCYTPGNFVFTEEDITVEINGKTVNYPEGTAYGKIMQDQLDADGIKIKVWDDKTGSSAGFDGWYNPAGAKEMLEKAKKELASQGLNISTSNPIYIDFPYESTSPIDVNSANSLKKSIEASLGGEVIVNLVGGDNNQYTDNTYLFERGNEANYSFQGGTGWGPDYGDPQTYLDTFLPEGAGYMVKNIGIY